MEGKNKIRLFFVGDFCAYNPELLAIGENLESLMNSCDIKFVNFEGPLQIGEKNTANKFYLKQSKNSPKWLMEKGFNVVGLANNHSLDFGEEGLKATVNAFKNIKTLGCGLWDDVYKVKYISLKGFKIGFFVASSADLSSLKDQWCDKNKFGCAWINHISVRNILSEAKKKCDYLIVIPHAGVEFMDVPLPEWRDIYRSLIDVGADIIIASHPHVPQGYEVYKNKYIFYSLGNFAFVKEVRNLEDHWYNSVSVLVELSENGVEIKHFLIKVDSNNRIEIDNDEQSIFHYQSLCEILNEDDLYIGKVNSSVLSLYLKYEGWLLSGLGASKYHPKNLVQFGRMLKSFFSGNNNRRVYLHQLREESTRWVMIRANKIISKTQL